jgi:hypothetical protein
MLASPLDIFMNVVSSVETSTLCSALSPVISSGEPFFDIMDVWKCKVAFKSSSISSVIAPDEAANTEATDPPARAESVVAAVVRKAPDTFLVGLSNRIETFQRSIWQEEVWQQQMTTHLGMLIKISNALLFEQPLIDKKCYH